MKGGDFLQSFKSVLQIIYYLIWVPLGLLLIAGILFMIVANPLAKLGQFGGPPGGFGGPAMDQGEPSERAGSNQGEFGGSQR